MLLTVTWPTIHERLSLFYVKKGHISTEKATTCKIPVKRNKHVPCTASAARPSLAVESGDLLSICSRSLICLKSGDAISRFTQSCSWLPEGENLEHQDTLSFTSAKLQCTDLDSFPVKSLRDRLWLLDSQYKAIKNVRFSYFSKCTKYDWF